LNPSCPLAWQVGRNSWGSYWGEKGFFRIRMHKHNLGIEMQCSFATPDMKRDPKAHLAASPPVPKVKKGTYHNYAHPCRTPPGPGPASSLITTPLPHTYMSAKDVPASYDVRDIGGVNYATINKNQHIPQYCGSCWAQATTSVLSDRINLMRKNRFPEIVLAAQVVVNCVTANETNGCNGGEPLAAFAWMHDHKVPDVSCQQYEAKDKTCDAIGTCENCAFKKGCWAVSEYPFYHAAQFGPVSGEANMMAEISARGPISCGMCVTEDFEAYSGGVYKDKSGCVEMSHEISIAGFGTTDDGEAYWIGRNSWGSYWGEDGWFRLARGVNNLGIESHCSWAVPAVTW